MSPSRVRTAAHAVICVAGMEGALASIADGLADCPITAAPISTGYETAMEGIRRCWP